MAQSDHIKRLLLYLCVFKAVAATTHGVEGVGGQLIVVGQLVHVVLHRVVAVRLGALNEGHLVLIILEKQKLMEIPNQVSL